MLIFSVSFQIDQMSRRTKRKERGLSRRARRIYTLALGPCARLPRSRLQCHVSMSRAKSGFFATCHRDRVLMIWDLMMHDFMILSFVMARLLIPRFMMLLSCVDSSAIRCVSNLWLLPAQLDLWPTSKYFRLECIVRSKIKVATLHGHVKYHAAWLRNYPDEPQESIRKLLVWRNSVGMQMQRKTLIVTIDGMWAGMWNVVLTLDVSDPQRMALSNYGLMTEHSIGAPEFCHYRRQLVCLKIPASPTVIPDAFLLIDALQQSFPKPFPTLTRP